MEDREEYNPDRRRYHSEVEYTRILQDYIDKDLHYKNELHKDLTKLRSDVDTLTKDTKDLVDSYVMAQKLTKGLVVVGQLLKYLGSMLLLYYSISSLLNTLDKH
jgi:carboxypeptidase C (cathepsin A)